jgi:hypothetical protein
MSVKISAAAVVPVRPGRADQQRMSAAHGIGVHRRPRAVLVPAAAALTLLGFPRARPCVRHQKMQHSAPHPEDPGPRATPTHGHQAAPALSPARQLQAALSPAGGNPAAVTRAELNPLVAPAGRRHAARARVTTALALTTDRPVV